MSSNIEDEHRITRREFTLETALALLAGVTITVTDCGGGDGGATTPTSPTPATSSQDVNGAVSANHGHVATVTAASIAAPDMLNLDIQGSATHPHFVDLTADEVRRIGARSQVVKTSTNNSGHQHTVTFN